MKSPQRSNNEITCCAWVKVVMAAGVHELRAGSIYLQRITPAWGSPSAEGNMETTYTDDKGRTIFLSQGIGDKEWGSFYRKESGASARVKSPYLPMRPIREEAEADLAAYAKKRGWRACSR